MFYYLHFTRPPPLQAHPSRPIQITPSISNDLRTEYFDQEVDIYYAWVKSDSGNPGVLGPMTPPQKLTTWLKVNAYKELTVFPPKNASEGEYWRLLLCTKPKKGFITSIDMVVPQNEFGAYIFPIVSMPVLYSSNNNATCTTSSRSDITKLDAKQFQNERVLRLGTPGPPIRIIEHLSYDLDKKVWDSGIGLSYWFSSYFSGTIQPKLFLEKLIHSKERLSVLELGAGTGLVSIVLAACLQRLHKNDNSLQARLIATDLPSAMEILNENISLNKSLTSPVSVEAAVLDWADENLPVEVKLGVDFIVMADVTYNTSSFPFLIGVLEKLSKIRSDPPVVLLAYKERDPDERKLWAMTQSIGLELEKIEQIDGSEGAPIEIYEGQFQKK